MLMGMAGPQSAAPGPWFVHAVNRLESWLADPDENIAVFVVDKPGGLAACALGIIEHRLGSPNNPLGRRGHVSNVATDPEYRRRGYARACMVALLGWFEERSVPAVDLSASPDGRPLYETLGFELRDLPSMRRRTHT
jgi:ribosomal protein S18 acetylase RimI-like enzyme